MNDCKVRKQEANESFPLLRGKSGSLSCGQPRTSLSLTQHPVVKNPLPIQAQPSQNLSSLPTDALAWAILPISIKRTENCQECVLPFFSQTKKAKKESRGTLKTNQFYYGVSYCEL